MPLTVTETRSNPLYESRASNEWRRAIMRDGLITPQGSSGGHTHAPNSPSVKIGRLIILSPIMLFRRLMAGKARHYSGLPRLKK